MRESQDVVLQFVKIVERFPVLYDNKMLHRPQVCMIAWEKVAEGVRHEMKEECTVDELRIKWKGIRSSFTRFKKKLHLENRESNAKQYYLYDALKFLHLHTRPKWLIDTSKEDEPDKSSENDDGWVQNVTIKAFKEGLNENAPIRTYSNTKDPLGIGKKKLCLTEDVRSAEIKTEPLDDYTDMSNAEEKLSSLKRRSSIDANDASSFKLKKTEEDADQQFFKSIAPDIANFTTQEKRKFKMGVLQLIDEIEECRKNPDYKEEF